MCNRRTYHSERRNKRLDEIEPAVAADLGPGKHEDNHHTDAIAALAVQMARKAFVQARTPLAVSSEDHIGCTGNWTTRIVEELLSHQASRE